MRVLLIIITSIFFVGCNTTDRDLSKLSQLKQAQEEVACKDNSGVFGYRIYNGNKFLTCNDGTKIFIKEVYEMSGPEISKELMKIQSKGVK